jgi:hypothetical protein
VAEIFAERVTFVRRREARVLGWMAFTAAVLPLLAFLTVGEGARPGSFLSTLIERGALLALPLAGLSALAGRDLFGAPGAVRREGDEIVVEQGGRARRLPLSAVKGGIMVPKGNRVVVELPLADDNQINVLVADAATAQTLLRELQVDVASQRCRVEVADRTAAKVVSLGAPLGLAYFSFTFLSTAFFPLLFRIPSNMVLVLAVGLYALIAALIQTLIAPPEITIGTDGLAFRRGLRETFVPFSDLEEVRAVDLGVRLCLRGGRSILVPSIAAVSNARLEALKLRIAEAMSLRDAAPRQALSQLDRAGRTVPAWRAALAALSRRGGDYRAAGLSTEDLEALLVSPDAGAERRLGAAVALSAGNHPGASERIRLAAAQCASERLRVALEKVSEGSADDEALAEALSEEEDWAAARGEGAHAGDERGQR